MELSKGVRPIEIAVPNSTDRASLPGSSPMPEPLIGYGSHLRPDTIASTAALFDETCVHVLHIYSGQNMPRSLFEPLLDQLVFIYFQF